MALATASQYREPRTTKPAPGHKIFPYFLRDLAIDRPNQVWAADITYIPIGHGFLYLVAVIDWFSRAVCSPGGCRTPWTRHSASMHAALARFSRPEIFNTDQGLAVHQRRLHRPAGRRRHPYFDGRPRPLAGSGVFIERLWRSLKYEDVYLKGYADGHQAPAGIASWIGFYNGRRPHQALAGRTP